MCNFPSVRRYGAFADALLWDVQDFEQMISELGCAVPCFAGAGLLEDLVHSPLIYPLTWPSRKLKISACEMITKDLALWNL